MRKNKNSNSFWLSYSDLMTSLFFVMLVLFIAGIAKYGDANVEKQKLEQILKLDEQFKVLSNSSTLRYDEEKKTFIAKDFEGIEIFELESDVIQPEYLPTVDKVGRDLEVLLQKLHKENPNFQYLLIIEGNSANRQYGGGYWEKDRKYNYELSYKRALALYYRWHDVLNIDLRKYNTEIQICGSGLNGSNRDEKVEDNNKRFVIQIIPKIAKHDKD
ncbi:MAG: hypothetical protein ACI4NO_03920 [Oxalobacter sp.]